MRRIGILFLVALIAAIWAFGRIRADEEPTPSAKAASQPNQAEASAAKLEQIAAWIKDLDDPHYQVREEASQHLAEVGLAALDPLLTVANGDRPEPADRAIWIMRRFTHSRDNALATAALEHLSALENRPALVAKALAELAQRSVAACEERLAPLGAVLTMQIEQINPPNVASVLQVQFGERWHGTTEDLRQLAQLKQQRYFRLIGTPVNDDVVKLFGEKEELSVLQLMNTKVTPAAVDAIKEKHPDAIVYVRNQALLGVSAENNPAGVRVMFVQPGSAADKAGIKQGDIIASIDGKKLPDFDRLTAQIAQHQPGDKINVEVVRNDKPDTLRVELGSHGGPND